MTEKDVYKNGVALLEEWEDVNYCEHNFKFKDEWLTDKEVVDLLNELHEKNEQLKTKNNAYIQDIEVYKEENTHLKLENEELKAFNQDLSENLSVCADKRLAQGEHLTKLSNENEQLKEPHCRKCIHFSCDNVDNYCMKRDYDSIDDLEFAKECKDYESVFE